MAGAAAITYEYLQPLFEVGSEEELDELEAIKEIMSSHPLLDAISQDENWKEQAMYVEDRDWDFHFLSRKTLKGANGISMVCARPRPDALLGLTSFCYNRHSSPIFRTACLV